MDTHTLFSLAIIFFVVALNAFFVAAEYALVSVRRTRMQEMADQGSSSAKLVLATLDDINPMLSTVQVGVTMCSLGVGYLGEPAVASLLKGPLGSIGLSGSGITIVAFLITFALMTWFTVIFGELLPKNAALQKTEAIAIKTIRPMRLLAKLFTPFNVVFAQSLKVALRAARLKNSTSLEEIHSEEELKILVSQSSKGGVLAKEEQEMLYKVFEFADKSAEQVMVPRPDVIAFEKSVPLKDLLTQIAQQPYTRYPIYDGEMDDIIGFLHTRDLLNELATKKIEDIELKSLVRETFIIPETKSLSDLLLDMRVKQSHMALVADEHGTLMGIVSLEDLLEELVGEIGDEHDIEKDDINQLDENTFQVEGSFSLSELSEKVHYDFADDDYQTVGGLIFSMLGRKPEIGDKVAANGYTFEVLEVDGARIMNVQICTTKSLLNKTV